MYPLLNMFTLTFTLLINKQKGIYYKISEYVSYNEVHLNNLSIKRNSINTFICQLIKIVNIMNR